MKQKRGAQNKCKEASFHNREEADKERKKMAKYLGIPEHLIEYKRCRKCGNFHFEKMKEHQLKQSEEIVKRRSK